MSCHSTPANGTNSANGTNGINGINGTQQLSQPHPLDPLTPHEISLAATIVRDSKPDQELIFRVITLLEPPKAKLLPFLEAEKNNEAPRKPPARVALVHFNLDSALLHQVKVDLGARSLFDAKDLPGRHSHTDSEQMQRAEKACLTDSKVQAVITSLDLPEDAVVCIEPWTYATDGMNDMKNRIIMCYFYMRIGTHKDSNHFAYPLDVCAELSGELKLISVYRLPSGVDDRAGPGSKKFDRQKLHTSSEYHPDIQPERRTTLKPLNVIQPKGPSFQTAGNLLMWERWRFRVGFNYREGLTIHDITYDGRSLFYRLSLSEMFVPYGDSRSPYPRKGAFDLGNDGAGVHANNLRLGCDCLGHIKYFDGWHFTSKGDPVKLPNAVCCHEVDDGVLWKHTNYRTGHAVVARSRVLILQTIITVGNYEYIFAFQFQQDASINYEVRATGILSTAPIDLEDKVPYGTVVAPGVMAPYHQHLFSLRIDPAIGGPKNSLVVEESHPMPIDDPSIHNPFGVGYTTTQQTMESETGLDLDVSLNRTFKIVNEAVLNPMSGTPISYKLVPHPSQMLLAHPSSFHAKRSEFTTHAVWVTRHQDDNSELFSSGQHTMQSLGGEGIASWIQNRQPAKREETKDDHDPHAQNGANGTTTSPSSVRDADLILWHTFGTTHNPRVEDWPVMPCEKMLVSLKPVNFFVRNPAIDVQLRDENDPSHQSVLVDPHPHPEMV